VRLGRRVLLDPIDLEKFVAANRVEPRAAAMATPRTIINTPPSGTANFTPARRRENAGDDKSVMR
jgi:hypothetical protein